jgi:hypothetical protein
MEPRKAPMNTDKTSPASITLIRATSRRPRFDLSLAVTVSIASAALAGCGTSDTGRLVPVAGKVTVDSKPLSTGSLVFKPDAAKGNAAKFEPSGTIGGDGAYSLFTKEKPGAPIGWYKVGIVAQQASANDPYVMKSLVPERYNDADTSGLEIEVVASPAPSTYDLKLAK